MTATWKATAGCRIAARESLMQNLPRLLPMRASPHKCLLCMQGAKTVPEDRVGWTPLCHAIAHGHVEVARVFFRDMSGRDDHRTHNDESLLHIAARHG